MPGEVRAKKVAARTLTIAYPSEEYMARLTFCLSSREPTSQPDIVPAADTSLSGRLSGGRAVIFWIALINWFVQLSGSQAFAIRIARETRPIPR